MELPRPPIKKTRVLAKAQREGELKAEAQHRAKTFSNKKQFHIWLVERLENLVDKIDPLKLVATVAMTVFVKTGIEWTEDIVSTALGKDSLIRTIASMLPILGIIEAITPEIPPQITQEALDTPQVEFIEWLISFLVAYMLVEHAGEIIQAGGNLLGVAKGLIGGLVG